MKRIKQAWLVLIGRAQALEVSDETFTRLHSEAVRYRMKPGDLVDAALDVHEEEIGEAMDFMIREKDLMDETKTVVDGA